MESEDAYRLAQRAMADLKAAVLQMLREAGSQGLRNADVGRSLGIYRGHSSGHEGHVSRHLLEALREEGVAAQGSDKRWRLSAPPVGEGDIEP